MPLLKFKVYPYHYFLMLWVMAVVSLMCLQPAFAVPPPSPQGVNACLQAIHTVSRQLPVPADMLTGVALTETGRKVNGKFEPWPWSINAEGKGWWFETLPEALAQVRALQASGVQSIDVGCMQINLKWHKGAFSSLEEAFNPLKNVEYAAQNMIKNKEATGSWLLAAGRHHSFREEHARLYRQKVVANLAHIGAAPSQGLYVEMGPDPKGGRKRDPIDTALSSGPFLAFARAPSGGLLRGAKGALIQLGQERHRNIFSRPADGS